MLNWGRGPIQKGLCIVSHNYLGNYSLRKYGQIEKIVASMCSFCLHLNISRIISSESNENPHFPCKTLLKILLYKNQHRNPCKLLPQEMFPGAGGKKGAGSMYKLTGVFFVPHASPGIQLAPGTPHEQPLQRACCMASSSGTRRLSVTPTTKKQKHHPEASHLIISSQP